MIQSLVMFKPGHYSSLVIVEILSFRTGLKAR
jgi:hypothetical protein